MKHKTLEEQARVHGELIQKFCDKFNVELLGATLTDERGYVEPMYYFSDNLGGYTLLGLENSLKD